MPSPVYSNSGANLFLSKLKGKFKPGHDHQVMLQTKDKIIINLKSATASHNKNHFQGHIRQTAGSKGLAFLKHLHNKTLNLTC